ncbi:DUF4157 domain-containing protein [Aphanizomenon flos-aquae NRERC-008]|uniref:eCIS core domain-containing protein n=1 Tax=Aphanizomenon flos-aquae TaxID=1176 RepID=UPI00287D79A5|nr:DUF4157 domain-containing protein [Aphanizomenon flos-aquae]MDS9397064.1 DUF4157 domain-containing protein [Aphanizomenon flos-aquae NRERC-008]
MNNRQHIQKKHPSQSTYTPVQNLYQTRAFDIQQQPSHSSSGQENVDLDADHEQSQYNRYNLPYIPVNAPGTEPPPPIQTQLNSGEPTNYYQQGSADVPWYNRPTYPNIPVNAPGTEPPPPIQTKLNSGQPTNYYQQGSADVAWYNRPTYPNIPVNAPGTEPPPPIQTKLNSGEPTNYYQQGSADVAWYNRPTYPNIPVNAPGTEPPPPIQTKLTIGQPGDKYEQEADQVASQVVQQINSPVPVQSAQGQTVQREDATPFEEEQVQAKSISDTIQREEVAPFEEEQLQAKSISDTIQREELPEEEQLQGKSLKGEIAATPNLETSIQGARGSGQPLDENIRQPMEKAFGGVDFSQVKVHNDAVSDQLNQSIQARAFTTGQDVFFRGGEYDPGSRGGQELIAHELTHVVQQTGAIQRQLETNQLDRQPSLQKSLTLIQLVAEQNYTPVSEEFDHTPGEEEAAEIGQEALHSVGYQKIIETALEAGFLRTVDSDESTNFQTKLQANEGLILRQVQAAATAGQVFTRYAITAGVVSQMDSPAPGPADVVAIGILIVGLAAAGYVLMAAPGNQADTGIMDEVQQLISAGTAVTVCAALELLMQSAKQAGDTERIKRIKKTQKAKGCRHSRHS